MVKTYYCKCCNYTAKQRGHYMKHLNTTKHKVKEIEAQKGQMCGTKNIPKQKDFECEFCQKRFTTKKSMKRHIKHVCKEMKNEDLKGLVCKLNEQVKEKDDLLAQFSSEFKKQQTQIDDLKKEIKHQNSKSKTIVSNSGTIKTKNTINHNNNTNLNNFNMGLLGYKETYYSHLTANDYKQCICNCNESVRTLINKVHFNDQKPENKYIYIFHP